MRNMYHQLSSEVIFFRSTSPFGSMFANSIHTVQFILYTAEPSQMVLFS